MIKKLKITALILVIAFSVFPEISFAQTPASNIPYEMRARPDKDCPDGTINTGLRCISVTPKEFTENILTVAIGIAGIIGLILLLYGFFLLAISAGNPDKVTAAKTIITSAIGGLIFITMSVVLMNFIGVSVLGLPGL